jgi:hypothetical protein
MHRRVWLLVAAFAALSLALGTGGFSAAELDRGVSVSVSDPGNAIVSLYDPGAPNPPMWVPDQYHAEPTVTGSDDTVPVVVVYNRFEGTDLTVDVEQQDGITLTGATETEVAVGQHAPVTGSIDCVGGESNLGLNVTADGDSMQASIEFDVTVDCRPEPTPTPTATPTPESNRKVTKTKTTRPIE